jgi:hypothetical protein
MLLICSFHAYLVEQKLKQRQRDGITIQTRVSYKNRNDSGGDIMD